jgi:hypothetical protein
MSFKTYVSQEIEAHKERLRKLVSKIRFLIGPKEYRLYWQSDGCTTVIQNHKTVFAFTTAGAHNMARKLAYGSQYNLRLVSPISQ